MGKNTEHEHTPFVKHAKKYDREVRGGKDNDTTVLVSIVVEKNEENKKVDDIEEEFPKGDL